jgi:hypothetical protein
MAARLWWSKGEVYATNDDSREKRNAGALWDEKSLFEQIAAKIEAHQ